MKEVKYFELDDKEEFICSCRDGDWVITDDLKLYNLSTDFEDGLLDRESIESRVIDIFEIGYPYSTYRLRQFCNEFHPEIDFDVEFETHRPGVFARYHEKFGLNYKDWVHETIFRELVDALAEKGYCLPFC
jgi:hypothetical protein